MKETVSVSLVQTLIQNCWKWTTHTVLITAFLVVIKLVILSALNKCKGLCFHYDLLLKKTMLKSFLFLPVWSINYSYCLHLHYQKYAKRLFQGAGIKLINNFLNFLINWYAAKIWTGSSVQCFAQFIKLLPSFTWLQSSHAVLHKESIHLKHCFPYSTEY